MRVSYFLCFPVPRESKGKGDLCTQGNVDKNLLDSEESYDTKVRMETDCKNGKNLSEVRIFKFGQMSRCIRLEYRAFGNYLRKHFIQNYVVKYFLVQVYLHDHLMFSPLFRLMYATP